MQLQAQLHLAIQKAVIFCCRKYFILMNAVKVVMTVYQHRTVNIGYECHCKDDYEISVDGSTCVGMYLYS